MWRRYIFCLFIMQRICLDIFFRVHYNIHVVSLNSNCYDSNYMTAFNGLKGEDIMSNSFHYLVMAEHSMFQKELQARLKGWA